jgi:hypothetical protein
VVPVYQGWTQNADGTYDMHFSYINQNWVEEPDIPVGPNNDVSAPYGPDAGQPTHFLPRQNRWQFTVRVPKDFGTKEVVWTLTAHGQTNRAYGELQPGYAMDDTLIQFEFGGGSNEGRKPPTLTVDGPKQRMVKVGQATPLVAVAKDDFVPPARSGRGGGGGGANGRGRGAAAPTGPTEVGPGTVGGDFIRSTAIGLRLAWFVYRGAGKVTFDPPMPFKVWEDQRGGSPWAPGFKVPPVPPDNKWTYNATFHNPGTYVLRAIVHTGVTFASQDITFIVTP